MECQDDPVSPCQQCGVGVHCGIDRLVYISTPRQANSSATACTPCGKECSSPRQRGSCVDVCGCGGRGTLRALRQPPTSVADRRLYNTVHSARARYRHGVRNSSPYPQRFVVTGLLSCDVKIEDELSRLVAAKRLKSTLIVAQQSASSAEASEIDDGLPRSGWL